MENIIKKNIFSIKIFGRKINFCICHQKPERTFRIKNFYFPVCSRCTGLIFGVLPFLMCFFFSIKINLFYIIFLTIPLIVDGTTQTFGLRKSNNVLRFFTGVLFSFSLLYILKVMLWP